MASPDTDRAQRSAPPGASADTPAVFPWPILLAMAAGTFATVTSEMLPAGLLEPMSADLGVAPSRIGLLVAGWAVVVAVASLPLAWATRKVSRRQLLPWTLAALALATLGTGAVAGYAGVVLLRLISAMMHGLFWSVVVVHASTLVAPRHRPRAVAVVLAGPTVASIAGIPLGTQLGTTVGWRASFVTWGGLLLVANFTAYAYVAPLLTGPGGFPSAWIGAGLLCFGAAGALGIATAVWISDRWPGAALPLVGSVFVVVFGLIAAWNETPAFTYVVLALWGFAMGLVPPVLQSRLLALASVRFRPTAGAVNVVLFNSGVASGALLGSWLFDHTGLRALPLTAAGTAALATAALAVCARRWTVGSPDAGAVRRHHPTGAD